MCFDPRNADSKKNDDSICTYLMKWANKLEMGDCDMFNMLDQVADNQGHKEHHSIVISCKFIGYNTYNVLCLDSQTNLIKYWHESY